MTAIAAGLHLVGGRAGLAARKHASEQAGAEPTRSGRVPVEVDCTLRCNPEVLVVHLTFLTGFKNRISALYWTISSFGRSRPGRTITAQQIFARQALASARGGDYVE